MPKPGDARSHPAPRRTGDPPRIPLEAHWVNAKARGTRDWAKDEADAKKSG